MDIKGFKGRDGTVHQYDFGSLANKPKDPADGKDGGYYTPVVTQLDTDTVQFEFTPSKSGMPAVAPVTVELPKGSGEDSTQNANGLNAEASALLITILRAATYPDDNDQSANITALETALGSSADGGGEDSGETEKALTSISAEYSGGDVPVGTAVTALTGVVVTAHYDDGNTETVTGYTLSGEIVEGSNTITVSYGGMTTTFTVTGVAESDDGGESSDGVTSINWFIETNNPDYNTIYTYGLKEPDNGYVVTTDTAHTALDTVKPVLAFPLIGGKTYSISIANSDAATQFFGLWVSTLNTEPIKGEITAVTDTIVKDLERWNAAPAGGYKDYAYTAGSGEYLMINANAGNVLTITAEVTA